MNLNYKATLISHYVQEWLKINNRELAKPADVAHYLKEKCIYNGKNPEHQLIQDLAKLNKRGKLQLIKGIEKFPVRIYNKWLFKEAK